MEMKDAASVATVMDEQPVETWNREKVLNWIRGREPELLDNEAILPRTRAYRAALWVG
jgi:hypothetical protein